MSLYLVFCTVYIFKIFRNFETNGPDSAPHVPVSHPKKSSGSASLTSFFPDGITGATITGEGVYR
jgi:hypothetical protein